MILDGPAIRANRFARIVSQKETYFIKFESLQIRDSQLFVPQNAIRKKSRKNPRVRKIRVRNSGAANDGANFMDA